MKITAIRVHQLDLPFAAPYSFSGGRLTCETLKSTIVSLETDSGISGVGESCPWGSAYAPAFATAIPVGIGELAQHLLGEDPLQIDRVNALMDGTLAGHPYIKAPIDLACWDILGKACHLPLYTLLGGAFRDSIPVQTSIPIGSPREMLNLIERGRDEGYLWHSCKIGSDVNNDIQRINQIVQERRPGETVTFDVNRAWCVADAIAVMNSIDDRTLCFEQPCETIEECRRVRELTVNPIILDECIHSLDEVVTALHFNCAQAIGIKLSRVGGLTKARKIRDLCVATGLKMNIEDTGGTLISDTASVHLALSTPPQLHRATWLCRRHHLVDVGSGGARVDNGRASVPQAPGIGITLDPSLFASPIAVYS